MVFGAVGGFTASLELSSLDGSNGFVLNGIDQGDNLGVSVSGAGDINGDGFDDILLGALGASPNGNRLAGESYVIFGSADFGDPVIPDNIAPLLTEINLVSSTNDLTLQIGFNEAISRNSLNPNNFQLFDSQGQIIPLEDILLRNEDRIIELSYDTRLEGDYSLIIQQSEITDLAGNAVADEDLNQTITVTDVFIPIIETNLINDTGNSNSDFITNDPRITGQIVDSSTITEFTALFDSPESGNFVNILEQLEPDGSFTLDETVLNQINGGMDLSDGSQTLILTATDEAGNTLEISEFSFTLDTTAPIPQITSALSNRATFIEIDFGEEIINGDDLNNYTLTRLGEGEISITGVAFESEGLVQLTLAEPLIGGENYRLDLDSAIEDVSGNALANNTSFDLNISLEFSLSTLDGSNGFVINGIDEFDRSGSSVSGWTLDKKSLLAYILR